MLSEGGILRELDLFYGEASNQLARIYARVSADSVAEVVRLQTGLSLGGFVRGPECEYCRTLPTTTSLVDMGPGKTLLAQAAVPDPCFWSPDVPSRYRVQVELKHHGQVVEFAEREMALRAFGARGRSLFLEGKRWVLRGVETPAADSSELAQWRDAAAAMIVSNPSDDLCREATRIGVLLVARVGGSSVDVVAELRRLAMWGAVAIAIIDSTEASGDELRRAAPNVLLAQSVSAESARFQAAPWAQLMMSEVDEPQRFAARVKECPLPVVAMRRLPRALPIAEHRAACDLLQRDLAPHGDFAGYLV